MHWSIIGDIAQLITALAVAYNVFQSWHIKKNVNKIEASTNSMKDDLVKAAGDVGRAEGHAIGLAQGRGEKR